MIFSIFSKPLSVPGLGKSRAAKSREENRRPSRTLELIKIQAANGQEMRKFTTSRYGTATERAKAAALARHAPTLEIDDADNGLSAALENAALLHASGQSDVALQLLAGAISNDPDTRCLSRAWHAQFDLLQRANNRDGFEQLALEYVTAFESSPPPWDDLRKAAVPTKAPRVTSGYFSITQVNVKTALEIPARAARHSTLKVDFSTASVFEELGCRRMVDVLRRLRRLRYPLILQGNDALERQIGDKTMSGIAQNEGLWLLKLELLQWLNDPQAFDERAIEYAVTFELSPPSWEPMSDKPLPGAAVAALPAVYGKTPDAGDSVDVATAVKLALKGSLSGPTDPQLAMVREYAAKRSWIPIDLAEVDRIDFVAAGTLQNILSGFIADGRQVRLLGASPIVEALLLLIGVDPKQIGS